MTHVCVYELHSHYRYPSITWRAREAKALCLKLESEIQSSDVEPRFYRGRSALAPRGEKSFGQIG